MITSGNGIACFDKKGTSTTSSFFTGGMDLQELQFDPFVTGYAFIIWTHLPKWVTSEFQNFKSMSEKNFKSFDGISDMTLNTATYTHTFNANEYNFASGISKDNTEFTIKHQEFSGSPIKNMYQYWVTGIRDPETNIATYPRKANMDYAAANHTGTLLYVVTRPDANNIEKNNIEFAAYYTNVMPTKVPLGHLNYSQNDNNGVEIDITFKGTMHISPKVDEFAKKEFNNAYTFMTEDMFNPKFGTNANVEANDADNSNKHITTYGEW